MQKKKKKHQNTKTRMCLCWSQSGELEYMMLPHFSNVQHFCCEKQEKCIEFREELSFCIFKKNMYDALQKIRRLNHSHRLWNNTAPK